MDCLGKPKKQPICWECIRNGGSFDRGCSIHHPEIYDEYAMPKKNKTRWIKKPTKEGWYWIRRTGATECFSVGRWGEYRQEMAIGYDLKPIELLWHCEFHPVEPPK